LIIVGEEFVLLYGSRFSKCNDYLSEALNKEQIQNRSEHFWGGGNYSVYVAPKDIERARWILNKHQSRLVAIGALQSDTIFKRVLFALLIIAAILSILSFISQHR
jgi:hypothetical protein